MTPTDKISITTRDAMHVGAFAGCSHLIFQLVHRIVPSLSPNANHRTKSDPLSFSLHQYDPRVAK
ncbi:hypothetical protein BD410DRAFT_789789 [Rickenella mellea]|uniref:Uncharacterized protein n=1 Tax=Rickenella mellea TaxID=50990 RepID=A0A4Y7Q241_9AGAM|nr:hypothetical protein BD410DRAFT_789789 [Rickenella mellea]